MGLKLRALDFRGWTEVTTRKVRSKCTGKKIEKVRCLRVYGHSIATPPRPGLRMGRGPGGRMTVEGMMAGGRRPENSHGGGRTQPHDRLGAMGWEHRCSTPRKRGCAYLVLLVRLDSLKNIERGQMQPVLRGVALVSLNP